MEPPHRIGAGQAKTKRKRIGSKNSLQQSQSGRLSGMTTIEPQLDSRRGNSRRNFKGHPVRFLKEYSKGYLNEPYRAGPGKVLRETEPCHSDDRANPNQTKTNPAPRLREGKLRDGGANHEATIAIRGRFWLTNGIKYAIYPHKFLLEPVVAGSGSYLPKRPVKK